MIELSTTREGLVVFTATGALKLADVASAYRQFLETTADVPRVLWDLSRATLDEVPVAGLSGSAQAMAQLGSGRHVPGRSAVLCRNGVDLGLVRLFVELVTEWEPRVEFEVFCDADEARTWLATGRAWPFGAADPPLVE